MWVSPRGATGGLGDIMGSTLATAPASDGISTPLDAFTPMQRVVLSANGNLQRLVSSYHDSPVTVSTRYSRRVSPGHFERQVDLFVLGTAFARATSTVHLEREDCVRAIEDGGVAIGQLFRCFNILPAFTLHAAGFVAPCADAESSAAPTSEARAGEAHDDGCIFAGAGRSFWRRYTLSGDGVECRIYEEIRCDLFDLPAEATAADVSGVSVKAVVANGGADARGGVANGAKFEAAADAPLPAEAPPATTASLGDIMAPSATFSRLPPGFSALQRVLLTANGNVERMVSSYYRKPAQLYVVLNNKRGAVYDREVALMMDGRQLMLAKSTCFLTDYAWESAAATEGLAVGALFRRFNVLPTFTLHAAGIIAGGFWRQYQLQAPGLTCEINETFDASCFGGDGEEAAAAAERESKRPRREGEDDAAGAACDAYGI